MVSHLSGDPGRAGKSMQDTGDEYVTNVRYLYSLQKFGIKLGLSKTITMLERMGNPHLGRRYVHIGGTNGKGSVGAFMASVLHEAGLKVGLYTSPHLVRFTERFRINGREMERRQASALIQELRRVMDPQDPPTYFETTTVMALLHFARNGTDIDVMEVGMGGRLDATNVITPLVSVITNISAEHREYLGSGILQIAAEKAGIIKEGVEVVTGATQPAVVRLFEERCTRLGASLRRLGADARYRLTASGLHYYGRNRTLGRLAPGLSGDFQARNAALALAALECLEEKGFRLTEQDLREGLRKARWPGRMHRVRERPTVLVDGAHNPAAARTLARALQAGYRYRRLIMVVGIMADKDVGAILRALIAPAHHVIYTRPAYPRAAEPETLREKAAGLGKGGEVVGDLAGALERAMGLAAPEDMVVVCGSLFTAGEALSLLDPEHFEPDIPA
ncbi:MAG: bifunctional folylpolyglutamate synthase/dihydrofolate synthase [Deltaproteobacteria bacterium]|nr:bifunctional folylpolyglutamate synthase/dihydrofolate synthase [Deltaproteobacteria bacterium]MBW1922328.1 bifunctional folylpolyglutamate synthase/dihydrofolate synthase [Deltaproteobacteria bacterium]MBW1948080.1 bifunctional folylpolyglutamate synthase/dihydrofolate synthase [Deltaproteobacteria bacterium]MBW2346447.1 bifunctional folylpolyglutamate synthase/dihydrofolate synthase [Deltaproteobacteria bacterium]